MVTQLLVVEEDARDDQRAGQTATPGLVDTCDVAQAELPVELEEAPSSVLRA
jgi:hypothetical protein